MPQRGSVRLGDAGRRPSDPERDFHRGSAASPGKAPASILGRKNQIAELQAALTQVTGDVTEAGRRKGALLSEQTALQAGLEEVRTELRTAEMAIAAREGSSVPWRDRGAPWVRSSRRWLTNFRR